MVTKRAFDENRAFKLLRILMLLITGYFLFFGALGYLNRTENSKFLTKYDECFKEFGVNGFCDSYLTTYSENEVLWLRYLASESSYLSFSSVALRYINISFRSKLSKYS